MCADAICSHVQNTGFSGGSIETMHWQGEWPGRAGVRRQGSSAGFVIDRALSHTQTPCPSDENRQTPLEQVRVGVDVVSWCWSGRSLGRDWVCV